jgi:hypothetical protein
MNEAMRFASTVARAAAPAAVSAGLKWAAVFCGLGLLVLLYLATAVFSNHWNPRKLVEGADGRASTSKFQWFLWLVVILFAYTALWVLRSAQGHFSALGETPVNLLTVLGFSTGTAVVAKGITTAYVQSGRVTKPAPSPGPTQPGIFLDDNGGPEVAKIQMVGLTIITIGIFLAAVTHQIVSNQVTSSLPDIDATLVVLMGISQVGYLGKKLVTSGPATAPSVIPDRPVNVIPDRPALASPRRYPRPRGGGQQVRIRFLAVLTAILAASAAIAVLVWFFSNPEGVTRQEATSNLVTFAVQTLALSAVTGFAAMATLEMVKRLFHLRGRFFFGRVAGPEFVRLARPLPPGESAKVDHEADVRRVDLPLEQLMAQLSYAADQALNQLFADRTEPGSRPPVRRARLGPPRVTRRSDRVPRDADDYKLLVRLVGEASLRRAESEGDPTMLRLETQVALDDLQVSVGNAWRWRLRLTSSALAALFALVALIYVPVPPGSKIAALAGSFLLGGFLAGFFRDLVAIVERFRSLCSGFLHTTSRYGNPVAAYSPHK